jgi:hypothetical protein
MGLWETVTQVGGLAGLGSLALGAGNTWYNVRQAREKAELEKAKPAQERQRELRARLRQHLLEAQAELKDTLTKLSSGGALELEYPPVFADTKKLLERLTLEGLDSPGATHRTLIEMRMDLSWEWRDIKRAEERLQDAQKHSENIESPIRQRDAARSALQTKSGEALETVEKYIGVLAKMDDGDDKLVTDYKG